MSSRSRSRERAHIRQLCCLGLGVPAILPDLQDAFHRILNHYVNIYTWLDENAAPINARTDVYCPDFLELFFNEFYNLLETYSPELPEVRIPMIAKYGRSYGNFLTIPKEFYETEFYYVLLGPFSFHKVLDGVVKVSGEPTGIVCFFREPSDPSFSKQEQELVRSLLPYLAHAEKAMPDFQSIEYCRSDTSGVIVATSDGGVTHICERAREILYWSLLEDVPQGGKRNDWMVLVKQHVKYLCGVLVDVFNDKDPSAVPTLSLRGRYGEVVYRAHWLDGLGGAENSLIVVNIEWKKPKQLVILDTAKQFNLSANQSELCMYLGTGLSKNEVCNSLGVTYNTYKDYLGQVYERLGVNNREALIKQLLHTEYAERF